MMTEMQKYFHRIFGFVFDHIRASSFFIVTIQTCHEAQFQKELLVHISFMLWGENELIKFVKMYETITGIFPLNMCLCSACIFELRSLIVKNMAE